MSTLLAQYPGHMQYAILFTKKTDVDANTTYIHGSLYVNGSGWDDDELRLIMSIGRSTISGQLGHNKPVNVQVTLNSTGDDNGYYYPSYNYNKITSSTADKFLAIAYTMVAMLLMNVIAREKEQELVGYLRSMGMPDILYWISWSVVINALLSIVSSFLVVIGAYCVSFHPITNVNFMIPWIILTICQYTIVGSSFILITIANSQGALNTMQFIMLISSLIASMYAYSSNYLVAPSNIFLKIFQVLVPITSFTLILGPFLSYEANYADYDNLSKHYNWDTMKMPLDDCEGSSSTDNICEMDPYLDYKPRECENYYYDDNYIIPDHCYFSATSHSNLIGVLILQYTIFFILTWYLFLVVPSNNGIPKKCWFIFEPFYKLWIFMKSKMKNNADIIPSADDNDEVVLSKESYDLQKLIIQNLTKEFKGGHKAVNNFNINLPNGQIFCLLGHVSISSSITTQSLS